METMLTEVAYRRFLASEYFFEQGGLEEQIELFFTERSLVEPGKEVLAERILNSIESHMGVLVQRALRVYSFSHLTFQEYFAAQRVARKRTLISEIGEYVGDARWREFWLLLVTMVDADDIITELKRCVDMLVAGDQKIQAYLEWCHRKAAEHENDSKSVALRAFFFSLGRQAGGKMTDVLTQANDQTRVLRHVRVPDERTQLEVALIVGSAAALLSDDALDPARDRDLASAYQGEITLARSLDPTLTYDAVSKLDLELDMALGLALEPNRHLDPYVDAAVARALARSLERAEETARFDEPTMVPELRILRGELPGTTNELSARWRQKLRAVAIQHCDIGHEWGWSATQSKRLGDYYRASQLLLECMNAARSLTIKTRRNTETAMLSPGKRLEGEIHSE